MRVVILLCALGGALFHSHVAHAQSATEGADAEARALFDAAVVAMDSGRYENALDYFERSYALSHRSQLLFNIGSAAERLRYDERALAAYERFLAENPDSESRDVVEARIAILRRSLAARAVPVETTPTETTPTETTPTETTPPETTPLATRTAPAHRSHVSVPVVIVGATLVAAAGGLGGYWYNRQSALNDCDSVTSASAVCVTAGDIRDERNLGRIATFSTAGVGVATVVIGLFVGHRGHGEDDHEGDDAPRDDFPRASVMCGPNGAGVLCAGRF